MNCSIFRINSPPATIDDRAIQKKSSKSRSILPRGANILVCSFYRMNGSLKGDTTVKTAAAYRNLNFEFDPSQTQGSFCDLGAAFSTKIASSATISEKFGPISSKISFDSEGNEPKTQVSKSLELYKKPSQPPVPSPLSSYKFLDCAIAPLLPRVTIERKFADAARGFRERWALFAKGKSFIDFQLERDESSLEAEFKNICYMRRAAWFINPHEPIKESTTDFGVAPTLLFADGARSRNCMAFAYNHTNTNYNASIIHLGGQRYIACEGPRKQDVDNFFRTLMAYKVTHLVRLTCAREGDESKCHPYWEGLHESDGSITTLNIPISRGFSYPIRIFDMEGWRDNQGVDPKELLAFALNVRKAVREKNGLLAIHCSAGVGRTGTFMAALAILDAIDKREPFSIEEITCRLSLQRFHSVGGASQYVTLHRLAEEYIKFLGS